MHIGPCQSAKVVYDKLSEVGAAPADSPEPWVIKSKVATLMAEVVRQEGASLWSQLMPDMAAGAASDSPVLAELSALVMRYVAEDVAVYNADIIGGKMKELLFGLTSTLPQALPALYRVLEVSLCFGCFFFCLGGGSPRREWRGRRSRAELDGGSVVTLSFSSLSPPRFAPMTKQPLRINHPNIPVWINTLTLFTRRRVSSFYMKGNNSQLSGLF